jgi:hypothetical protein
LQVLNSFEVIAALAVLSRLETFDENRLHGNDDDVNGKVCKLRSDGKSTVIVDRIYAES